MPNIDLIAFGKLNLDVDVNSLPQGDYVSARNVVVGSSSDGGKDTVKIMESIKELPISQSSGTIKASLTSPNGTIYQLYRTGSANAAIYKTTSALDNKTLVISYAHGATTDFTPDLDIVGDILVWNYHGEGTLLYWDTKRVNGATITLSNLVASKAAPTNVLSITKNISLGQGSASLENNDFQFACRYKYDTGEYSVLGNYTNMFKAEEDSASYSVSFILGSKPAYAVILETYARKGNSGTWQRIRKDDISGGSAATLTWKGDMYETLSDAEALTSFSAVPSVVKNVVVAVDRVWVSNFKDDHDDDAAEPLVITPATGYSLGGGGTIKNYFGADTTDAAIKSSESGTFYKPFANNSTYSIGAIFTDDAEKTTGVVGISSFSTGLFSAPYAPSFNLSGNAKPSWAKWMQLAITRNTTKSRVFEGFANSVFFELEVGEDIQKKLSITNSDLQNVKSLVLDISGMFKGGLIYSYNSGDRITVRIPNTTVTTTDSDGSKTGAYRTLDMKVIGSDGSNVYVNWIGGGCLNDAIPDATELYFEIYSPTQESEDDNLRFYAIGSKIDITGGIPGSITDYTIGDMVFSKFSMPVYEDQLLYKGLSRSFPAEITSNATTIIGKINSGGGASLALASSILSSSVSKDKAIVAMNKIGGTNDDEVVAGNPIKIKGFYDSNCTINVVFNYLAARTISGNIDSGSPIGIVRWKIFISLQKTPFNIAANVYDAPVRIGERVQVYENTSDEETLSGDTSVAFSSTSVDFSILSSESILSSGDIISVVFDIQTTCSDAAIPAASLELKEAVSGDSVTMTIVGDRITPVESYSDRNTVDSSTTSTSFAIRKTANRNIQEWNFSGGKPFLEFKKSFSEYRGGSFRPSSPLIQGTSVNGISMFSSLETGEVAQENGSILSMQRANRLQGQGDMLIALCEMECTYILLGEVDSTQSGNSPFKSLISGIIGSIRNYGERVGIQAKSDVFNHNGTIYGWDGYRNIVFELSKRGVDLISKTDVDSHFVGLSGAAKFAVDPFYNLLLIKVAAADTIAFSIDNRAWRGFFDIDFVLALYYGEKAIYFSGGKVYGSLDDVSGNVVGEYLGVAYDASITYTANSIMPIIPRGLVVNHNMDVIDYTNDNNIKSDLMDLLITNENGQETPIEEVNFLLEDNKMYAHVLRDVNSSGGIISGDHIKGYINHFKLTLKDNTQKNRIFGLKVNVEKVAGHY